MTRNLAQRSVISVKWNIFGTATSVVVGFIQTVILSRLLPVETFGIYAIASSIVVLVLANANFGMGSAFLHRVPETENIETAAATHFTLKLMITTILSTLMLVGVLVFTGNQQVELRLALIVIIMTGTVSHLTQTPRIILIRQVMHQRLAMIDTLNVILTSIFGIGLALAGATLWALLISNVVTMAINLAGLYLWRPVWRIALRWNLDEVRYFISYGSRNVIAGWLLVALDNFDDLCTGAFLGAEAAGFYSRAYRLARYPNYLIATPVNHVAMGTYAELKERRKSLSTAFMQSNSLIVRSGFFLAGTITLIAPELVLILLGDKWLPMLTAFQLMLVYALFAPMKETLGSLFLAVGQPGLLVRFRLLQLLVLVGGLFTIGIPFGISGVALAVDLMLIVGIGQMLWQARKYVDFSVLRLLFVPLIAAVMGLLAGFGSSLWHIIAENMWLGGLLKIVVFTAVYGVALFIWDRQQIMELWTVIRQHAFGQEDAHHVV